MSSGGNRGTVAAGPTAAASIPAGPRKIVQSLKEIVNSSEAEIYAMLKECNMDPSEAVHRLLSQDTFQEVKSKREKKKETRDTPDSRSRSYNNSASRGARAGTDHGGRTGSNQNSYNGYGAARGKPVNKKESGTNSFAASIITGSGSAGNDSNRRSTMHCEAVSIVSMPEAMAMANGPPLPSQSSSGFQHNWSRVPGQMSIADIVRMGRPQGKPSIAPTASSGMLHASHDPISSNWESTQELHTSQYPIAQEEERPRKLGTVDGHSNTNDDWSTHPKISDVSLHADPSTSSSLQADEANLEQDPYFHENQVQDGDATGDGLPTESIRSGSVSVSSEQVEADYAVDSTHHDAIPLNGMNSYHLPSHAFEHQEVEDANVEISAATANLQQLNLHKGEVSAPSAEETPAVIIPSHLQVSNGECSYLSFGSFGSGVNSTPPGSFPSKPLSANQEAAPISEDAPVDHLNSRNPEYYNDDELKSTLNENVASLSSTSTSTRIYDMPSNSQPEIRDDALDAAGGLQGNTPSVSSYTFSAPTQSPTTHSYPDLNSQMQNLSPFSSLMQQYTNSLPSSLLAPTVQPPREFDIPFSALHMVQSTPTNYSTATPSISGTVTMPEAKPDVFSTTQPTPEALPAGPALPQHLPIHAYSQQLAHFANMIGYPFLPQSYTFLPYAANSPFHQSLVAGMKYQLPQYKSSVSAASSLPGYGGFTSSPNNVTGNLSTSMPVGFEDALSSQYKNMANYLPVQQNENSATWFHGAASRAVAAHPGNTLYNYPGQQTQQNYRQVQQQQQQPSQYGPMGYLNLYQLQGGTAQEQHQPNPSEANSSGSHTWQHGY